MLAFDTGPGNMIIDRAAQVLSGGRLRFDAGGRMAARGKVDEPWLEYLLRHPYFKRRPPKSTGREMFGRAFADRLLIAGPPARRAAGGHPGHAHGLYGPEHRRGVPAVPAARCPMT